MDKNKEIPLIKVKQWLNNWDRIHWREGLEKPADHFYVGSMVLEDLRSLAGVTTREIPQRANPKVSHGYQRAHEENRSKKINRYIHNGYPLSVSSGLNPDEHEDLINPGWLPNAIIINIIPSKECRYKDGKESFVPEELSIKIDNSQDFPKLSYPNQNTVNEFREKSSVFAEPIEIIDGQHRLFAADYGDGFGEDYEVPIVVFNNLSLGWQAYLFWTINVEPKKINPSLAFDIYPELRRQEWLEKSESIKIYQEHRSQELTEVMWSHPQSPWRNRIELHGKRVKGHVSNAAFIRSLNASFIKRWIHGDKVGGLFGSIPTSSDGSADRVIPWKRSQQAAFLILIWKSLCEVTASSQAEWRLAISRNEQKDLLNDLPSAFAGEHSLLATDQGIRAVHNIFNAIFQHIHDELRLSEWYSENVEESPTLESVDKAISSFTKMPDAQAAIDLISKSLIDNFDWRVSSAPQLSEPEKRIQAAYRGSGGYSLMMKDLLVILEKDSSLPSYISDAARAVSNSLIKG